MAIINTIIPGTSTTVDAADTINGMLVLRAEGLGFRSGTVTNEQKDIHKAAFDSLLQNGGVVSFGPYTYNCDWTSQLARLTTADVMLIGVPGRTKLVFSNNQLPATALFNMISGSLRLRGIEFELTGLPGIATQGKALVYTTDLNSDIDCIEIDSCTLTNWETGILSSTGMPPIDRKIRYVSLTNNKVRCRGGLSRFSAGRWDVAKIMDNDIDCGLAGIRSSYGGIVWGYVANPGSGEHGDWLGNVIIERNVVKNVRPTADPGSAGNYGIQTNAKTSVVKANHVSKVFFQGGQTASEVVFTGNGTTKSFKATLASLPLPDMFNITGTGVSGSDQNTMDFSPGRQTIFGTGISATTETVTLTATMTAGSNVLTSISNVGALAPGRTVTLLGDDGVTFSCNVTTGTNTLTNILNTASLRVGQYLKSSSRLAWKELSEAWYITAIDTPGQQITIARAQGGSVPDDSFIGANITTRTPVWWVVSVNAGAGTAVVDNDLHLTNLITQSDAQVTVSDFYSYVDYNTGVIEVCFATPPANGLQYTASYTVNQAVDISNIECLYFKTAQAGHISGNVLKNCAGNQAYIGCKGGGSLGWLRDNGDQSPLFRGSWMDTYNINRNQDAEALTFTGGFVGGAGSGYGYLVEGNFISHDINTGVFDKSTGVWVQSDFVTVRDNFFFGLTDKVARTNPSSQRGHNLVIDGNHIRGFMGTTVFGMGDDWDKMRIDNNMIEAVKGATSRTIIYCDIVNSVATFNGSNSDNSSPNSNLRRGYIRGVHVGRDFPSGCTLCIAKVSSDTAIITGTMTSGNSTITAVSNTHMRYVAFRHSLSGTDVPTGAFVSSFDLSAGTITMNANATGTGSRSITVGSFSDLTIADIDSAIPWTMEDKRGSSPGGKRVFQNYCTLNNTGKQVVFAGAAATASIVDDMGHI